MGLENKKYIGVGNILCPLSGHQWAIISGICTYYFTLADGRAFCRPVYSSLALFDVLFKVIYALFFFSVELIFISPKK